MKNYYQHIIDVLKSDGIEYEDISDTFSKSNYGHISTESIQASHQKKTRGNLPRGIAPAVFYDCIIHNFFESKQDKKNFASKLCLSLKNDGIFPDECKANEEKINGNNDAFDSEFFRNFVIHLLDLDKKSKKDDREANKIKIQKNSIGESGRFIKTNTPSPIEFSSRFFHAGARAIIDANDFELEKELEKLSGVFYNISTIKIKNSSSEIVPDSRSFMTNITDYIVAFLRDNKSKEILKIEGPLGSYKNRIMQYLYLALERKAETFVPIYIDIASYEKAAEKDERINEKDFLQAFEKDIEIAEEIVSRYPGKTPLLLLDGIRDFFYCDDKLYYEISRKIKKDKKWSLIVCEDTDFTINVQNKYGVRHPLITTNYDCYLRIRSMNLHRRVDSIEFIKNCITLFDISLHEATTAERIYESLVRLNFLTIDAYWLVYVLNLKLNDILNQDNNISDIYTAVCSDFLGSQQSMETAAQFAYDFEFGRKKSQETNPFFDLRWRLIRKHRSVLDFLIAKHYIKKVSELDLKHGSREENKEKLQFFNMVLQKNITRFVVTMLKGVDDYEKEIMIIARKYYDDLNLFGKSELTFWMARLESKSRREQCIGLLKDYDEKEKNKYSKNNFSSEEEKRNTAFLIRGINVSLIYEGDKEALKYYMDSLLTDKVANSVNRGFHLEYYGDKPYIPNKALLDFEDDITKGESTLTVICLSLDRRIRRNDISSLVAPLEVMTLCNLLQARMEQNFEKKPMNIAAYIDKCIKYIEWIMPQQIMHTLPKSCSYFNWFRDELKRIKEQKNNDGFTYNRATVFNMFHKVNCVERAGWVTMNVPKPENVTQHIYNCWLIGFIYLPETYDIEGYSKEKILKLLLLHDLAESVTGDVDRRDKMRASEQHKQEETEIMHSLFLSGTYPQSVNLTDNIDLWNFWCSRPDDINVSIAKDIDEIQAIYQACDYYLQYPECFVGVETTIEYWLSNIQKVKSDIGRNIVDALIVDNPKFQTFAPDILDKII